MSKKARQNRKKQVASKTTPVAPTGMTRRQVIIDTMIAGVVSGEIVKYLPGPSSQEKVVQIEHRFVDGFQFDDSVQTIHSKAILPSRAAGGRGSITQG